ncbi:MAG: hypothetical protein J1F35_06845 [Erysipelotrichales bacterium]|nr:hypothetical protein [Erysipelotrichales bacterium]
MLYDIVDRNLKRIENDLKEIEGLKCIDFMDIFPTSEDHKVQLDQELISISTILEETERGIVYALNNPIDTKYGKLKYVKIRFFDETRLNWEAAADFAVVDRNILLDKVGKDNRFKYIERPDWDAVEFKTNNTLIYFLEPLASEVYNDNKEA